jgi:hypothetical protein
MPPQVSAAPGVSLQELQARKIISLFAYHMPGAHVANAKRAHQR